jgi:hypothetical protein
MDRPDEPLAQTQKLEISVETDDATMQSTPWRGSGGITTNRARLWPRLMIKEEILT